MKSTIALHDANLSGKVVWITEDSAQETGEYILERAGLWTRFEGTDGDILLSEGWSVDFFEGQELSEDDLLEGEGTVTHTMYEEDGSLIIEDY